MPFPPAQEIADVIPLLCDYKYFTWVGTFWRAPSWAALPLVVSSAPSPSSQPLLAAIVVAVVQLPSHARLFVTPWTAHGSLPCLSPSPRVCPSSFMSIKSVMPSNHLILYRPLLLPSVFPNIRVFSSESVVLIRWPEHWSFSISSF